MRILRFDDNRVGVLKHGDRVVDVTDAVASHREKFFAKGHGPRKDTGFTPGVTQVLSPVRGTTRVQ